MRLVTVAICMTALCSAQAQRGAIRGAILDELGRPMAGVSAKLSPVTAGQAPQNVVSDRDGTFQIANLEPGLYSLELSASFYWPVTILDLRVDPFRTLEIPDLLLRFEGYIVCTFEPEDNLRILGRPNGSAISGTLWDTAGKPLSEATVQANCKGCKTTIADDGTFRLENVPRGKIDLVVSKPGFFDEPLAAHRVRTGFETVLKPMRVNLEKCRDSACHEVRARDLKPSGACL